MTLLLPISGLGMLPLAISCQAAVPAITVPHEYNVLINPLHPHMRRITHAASEPVVWDRRLFGR